MLLQTEHCIDVSDVATNVEEIERQAAIAYLKNTAPIIEATGFCLFCGDDVPENRRWCDADCRDDWEKRNK